MFTFATLCILPFTGRDLLSTDWQALSAAAIGSLAFIVVGSTFLSYMLIIVGQKNLRPTVAGMYNYIIRKSKCSTDFKRNDFLKKTKRTHWVRFVHLNSLIESCVFLYLWNSPFDTFL